MLLGFRSPTFQIDGIRKHTCPPLAFRFPWSLRTEVPCRSGVQCLQVRLQGVRVSRRLTDLDRFDLKN